MPCTPLPPGFFPSPPSLPGGVGLPTFSPPTITSGFCCNIQVPPWGSFPIPLPPLPPGALEPIIALFATIEDAVTSVFDAISIPCPTQ